MSIYVDVNDKRPHKTETPQSQPLPGREDEMVKNSAGGYTFKLDMWGNLDRFLILGSDTPTYYASARKLTEQNSKYLKDCVKADGIRTVARIKEISQSGRAPKNDPAVFALAIAAVHGNADTVKAAYTALPDVCRIGTHLFQFVNALDALGKWNAAAKRGVAKWYTDRRVDRLAIQMLKYQNRDGWTHTDVLRLAHVKPDSVERNTLFKYVVKNEVAESGLPDLVYAVEKLKTASSKDAVKLIEDNSNISWEMIPTELMKDKNVQMALLPNMGMTAVIRQLGRLTALGILDPLSEGAKLVVSKINDVDAIKGGRVHPVTILNALATYKQGRGDKGTLTWSPNQRVVDALDDAFYEAFNYVESTGKGFLFGIDISGSMFGSRCTGFNNITTAEAAGVMALAVAKRETNYEMFGFDRSPKELKITPKMSLSGVITAMRNLRWNCGGTDCAQPMLYALDRKIKNVDTFAVFTDCETWAGNVQPVEALARYRKSYVPNAKLVVAGFASNGFTIADPKDPGMLDVVGLDSSVPQLIQTF